MAKVYLDPGDEYRIVNDNVTVFGSSDDEQIIVESGADNVVADANVERVDFAGNVSDFTFKQAGNQLLVFDSEGKEVAQVGVQEDGTELAFTNGLVELTLDPDTHAMLLGGAEVSSDEAAAVEPTQIDDSQTSEASQGTTTTPQISISDVKVTEGNDGTQQATVIVTLSQTPAQGESVTVDWATQDGTATTADNDYAEASGTLTFGPGEVQKTITVDVNGDLKVEDDETFNVVLSNVTGQVQGQDVKIADDTGVVTIQNDDKAVDHYVLVPDTTQVEEGNAITFTLKAVDADGNEVPVAQDMTFSFNVSGSDLNGAAAKGSADDVSPASGNITLEAGQSSTTFRVTPVDDNVTEGMEGFKVTILDSNFSSVVSKEFAVTDPTGVNAGATYVLTDKQDNVFGTDYDDLIYATASTLQDFDVIDGKDGTDTFQLASSVTGATTYYPNLSNVEILKVRALGTTNLGVPATTNVDLSNASGISEIVYDKGTANLAVQNIPSVVSVTAEGGSGGNFILDFKSDVVSGSDDSIDVTLKDANLGTLSVDNFETVNLISSEGTWNSITTLNTGTTSNTIKTVNISGDSFLNITSQLAGVETINASDATGGISVSGDPAALEAFTGSSGNDTLYLTGANIGVTSLTIDGGDGTDKVVVDNNSYDELQDSSKVTMNNVEIVRFYDASDTDVTLDASKLSGISTFEIQVADPDNDGSGDTVDITISNVEGEVNVVAIDHPNNDTTGTTTDTTTDNDISDANDGVKIKVDQKASYSGTDDVLNFTIKNGEILNEVNADGFETVNITSTADSGSVTNKIGMDGTTWIANGLVDPEAKTINVSGDQDLELRITNFKEAVSGNTSYKASFDASEFTGDLTVVFTESANQKITLGSGDDTVTLNAGSLDKNDIIDGGDGTDTVKDTSFGVTTGDKLNITNVETLELGLADAAVSTDLSNDTALKNLKIELNSYSQNYTFKGIADGVTVSVEDGLGGNKTLELDAVNTDASMTIKFTDTDRSDDQFGYAGNNEDLKTNVKTLTIINDADDSDTNVDDGVVIDDFSDTSLESLTLKSDTTNESITIKDIDSSNLASIVCDTTGSVTLGNTTPGSIDGITLKSDASVTLGGGDDSFVFDLADHKNITLEAGNGIDTLYLTGSLSIGPAVIDLSSTSDQITQINGVTNSAVQKGFENVNASGITTGSYGISVTGSSAGNTIVGSAKGDDIHAGDGVDIITGGAGNDTIYLGASDGDADVVKFENTTDGQDVIYDYVAGTDKLLFNNTYFVVDGIITSAAMDITTAAQTSTVAAENYEVICVTDNAAADWSNVVTTIGNAITVTDAGSDNNFDDDDKTIILIDNGTDTRIYYFSGDQDVGGNIDSNELTLIGTLDGISDCSSIDQASLASGYITLV